jgi:hypothetical protein
MVNRYERAELLTALWKLGADDTPMPTSHGILDRALLARQSELPSEVFGDLVFSVTGVGLRCLDLPDILLAAQEALLTSEPNPTYVETRVTLDLQQAREIALSHDLTLAAAREIGRSLKDEVEKFRNDEKDSREPIAA